MFASTLRASLLAFAFSALAVSAAPGLSVKVSVPSSITEVGSLSVVTTVTNTGDETLKLINDPSGPLSHFPTDKFAITFSDGKVPKFTGVRVKWTPTYAASVNDITTLAPGQSVEVVHDLKKAYNFAGTGDSLSPGTYSLLVRDTPFYALTPNNEVAIIRAAGRASIANLKLDKIFVQPEQVDMPLLKRAKFTACSEERESDLRSAIGKAHIYASEAQAYFQSNLLITPGPRYTTWFGIYNDSLGDTVLSHFSKINSNNFSDYTYDCSCRMPSVYAYVYPNDFGVVYLCGAFWKAPETGTDSKAGTIIHESSHFTANGGTDDHVYGQAGAKRLAINSPVDAVMNADNHEYFAENNPLEL